MEIVAIEGGDRQNWNDFVAEQPAFGLLQSYEWGDLKEDLGWQVIRLAVRRGGKMVAGAQMLVRSAARGLFSVAYIPRGPLVDWEDAETTTALLRAIHDEARRRNAICLKIEPPLAHDAHHHQILQNYGFRPSAYANQPRCSMVVDLPDDGNMDELLANLPSSTRYNIRKGRRKGVTIDIAGGEDFAAFVHLMRVTGERNDFPVRSAEYYRQEWEAFSRLGRAQLLIARYQGQAIAAQMPFCFGQHAATFHAGSLNEYRELKAGYLMMWMAMRWARQSGCRSFDLWGIPEDVGELTARGEPIPQDRTDGLWGVYYYKNAFRGRVVYYVGAYDYVYSAPASRAVDFATKCLGSLDKLAWVGDRLR
ncbi:MAG: peptidoglycan bridge formation glycyltransferase FemA/FemB family protein [Chloroflexi bacterium]|nr:peptidoglycan bridge formation glycyltransferase FemA/FemB family protein [Chloroflexota bacterium]